jgi:hypothetical protein
MIDPTTLQTLQALVGRETRSVLHYAADADPWTTPDHKAALGELKALIAREREALAPISRLLFRHHVVPPPAGGYPTSYTTLNFLSLDALVARLIASERSSLEQARADLRAVTDPEARSLVEALVALKQKNLQELGRLSAPEAMVQA